MKIEAERRLRMTVCNEVFRNGERFSSYVEEFQRTRHNPLKDLIESALELNSLTLDTIDFLFGEMGGVEINDGFIVEV